MGSEHRHAAAFDAVRLIGRIARARDRAAFAELFDFYAPRIKALLMRAGATAETADDCAQEALLTVWRKAHYFDPARASASAWIFTIARNLRIDGLRREGRARAAAIYELIEPAAPEQPDQTLSATERDSRVREAVQGLSADQLRVVKLAFFEGIAHADIAKTLNIPLGTVKSRLRLAMNRLRDFLGDLT